MKFVNFLFEILFFVCLFLMFAGTPLLFASSTLFPKTIEKLIGIKKHQHHYEIEHRIVTFSIFCGIITTVTLFFFYLALIQIVNS